MKNDRENIYTDILIIYAIIRRKTPKYRLFSATKQVHLWIITSQVVWCRYQLPKSTHIKRVTVASRSPHDAVLGGTRGGRYERLHSRTGLPCFGLKQTYIWRDHGVKTRTVHDLIKVVPAPIRNSTDNVSESNPQSVNSNWPDWGAETPLFMTRLPDPTPPPIIKEPNRNPLIHGSS